jgi:hypothetical protein
MLLGVQEIGFLIVEQADLQVGVENEITVAGDLSCLPFTRFPRVLGGKDRMRFLKIRRDL